MVPVLAAATRDAASGGFHLWLARYLDSWGHDNLNGADLIVERIDRAFVCSIDCR